MHITSIDKFFYQHVCRERRENVLAHVRGMGLQSVQRLDNLAVSAEEQEAKRLAEEAAQQEAEQEREAKKQRAKQKREEREAKKQRAEQKREEREARKQRAEQERKERKARKQKSVECPQCRNRFLPESIGLHIANHCNVKPLQCETIAMCKPLQTIAKERDVDEQRAEQEREAKKQEAELTAAKLQAELTEQDREGREGVKKEAS